MLISERPLVWKPTLDPTTFTNFYFWKYISITFLFFWKVSKLTDDWSYNLRDFLILAKKKYLHNFSVLESYKVIRITLYIYTLMCDNLSSQLLIITCPSAAAAAVRHCWSPSLLLWHLAGVWREWGSIIFNKFFLVDRVIRVNVSPYQISWN
jgi:hypothetical protein